MSAPLTPLQYVRPPAEPRVWSCYNDPKGQMRLDLSPDEIAGALAAGDGTLWVDIDTVTALKSRCCAKSSTFTPWQSKRR